MKAVVVYESYWGNTKQIAEAIAEGIGPDTPVLATDEATPEAIEGADLIVAGAPIHGFSLPRESARKQITDDKKAPFAADVSHPTMREWLTTLPAGSGRGAGFDTRASWSPGSSAKKIRRALEKAGLEPVAEDGEFVIEGTYGPMKDGEVQRAREWGARLAQEASA
jgi:flavodoxin